MDEFNTTINNISPYLTSIYSKIAAKGGTVPAQKNLHNVAAAVQSIPNSTPTPTTDWGIIYSTEYPDGQVLASQSDYEKLGRQTTTNFEFSFGTVGYKNIIGFEFGSKPTSVPDYFLYSSGEPSLFTRSMTLPDNITEIGNNFMHGSGFAGKLTLPSTLKTIGKSFLSAALYLRESLTIPASVTDIKADPLGARGFMSQMNDFTGPLVLQCPASVLNLSGNEDLTAQSRGTMAYTLGITLTGTYAAQWKAKLPNNSSDQYPRNLLLG